MCGLADRLQQMAIAQMSAKDTATLHEAAGEILRLREELNQARVMAHGMKESSLELLAVIKTAGWVKG